MIFSDSISGSVGSLVDELSLKVPRHEAELIIWTLFRRGQPELSRAGFLSMRVRPMDPDLAVEAREIAIARASGRILQHLLGVQAFLSHDYRVGPDVLVPRPETEVLVTEAFAKLKMMRPLTFGPAEGFSDGAGSRAEGPGLGVEIGIGSGVISIELLSRFERLEMIATDASELALQRSRENTELILGAPDLVRLRGIFCPRGEVWPPIDRELRGRLADFVISNPPYLMDKAEATIEVDQQEPALALYAPEGDALYFYREIAEGARSRLTPSGLVLVEIPHERSAAIRSVFEANAWQVDLKPDLTGRPRVLIARSSGADPASVRVGPA